MFSQKLESMGTYCTQSIVDQFCRGSYKSLRERSSRQIYQYFQERSCTVILKAHDEGEGNPIHK